MTALVSLSAIVLAAVNTAPVEGTEGEASCVIETLDPSARASLVDALAAGEQARSAAALQDAGSAIRVAMLACNRRFAWSQEERTIVAKAFEYSLRFGASIKRLSANGLTEQASSDMFEALPGSMHEAIFGLREMTPEEMRLLQAGFEPLVDRLDGPDGNALSEYITARAGYGHYSRELLSR